MGGILDVGQIQPLGVDSEEQVRNGAVTGETPELVAPLGQILRLLLLLGHHLDGVERSRVGYDGLPGLDDLAVLESDAGGPAVLDDDLVDVSVHLKLTAELLESALERLPELGGAADGDREGGRLLEESLENVQNVGRHGSLGGEAAENAHEIDEVADEGDGDDFVDGLGEIVEGEGKVGEDVGVLDDEGEGSGGGGEESGVLSEVEEGDGRGGAAEGLETVTEGIPLPDGLGPVFPALLREKLLESLLGPDGEAPITLGGPESESLVRLDGHGLLEDVENHPQGVETRPVQPLEDGRSDLEAVFPPIVHPGEGVGRPPHLNVTLEAQYLGPVLGRQRRARQPSHARPDHDNVIFALLSAQSVPGTGIRRLLVFLLQAHVVREGHDLVAGRILRLGDVLILGLLRLLHLGGLEEAGGGEGGGRRNERARARRRGDQREGGGGEAVLRHGCLLEMYGRSDDRWVRALLGKRGQRTRKIGVK
mmetsp:Transcript_42904/g.130563  ORF Transcript_42904/g.130563 Transcript_42904/m.130563 type:complete len:480 (+) Transcript_42904:356-1795(+)